MAITLTQAKALQPGTEVWTISTNPYKKNKVCRIKVNGQPKTWKTRPEEVSIPWKYGLYEYGRFSQRDLSDLYMTREECEFALKQTA